MATLLGVASIVYTQKKSGWDAVCKIMNLMDTSHVQALKQNGAYNICVKIDAANAFLYITWIAMIVALGKAFEEQQ